MTKTNEQKGITLVALIITIVILLILATVSISLFINTEILEKTKLVVDNYSNEILKERKTLSDYEQYIKTAMITNLTGTTWEFKNTISYDTNNYFNLDGHTSNEFFEYDFTSLIVSEVATYNVYALSTNLDKIEEAGYTDGDALCYVPENSLGLQQGWSWANIHTLRCEPTNAPSITITGGDDVTNIAAIQFLTQNATLIN